MSVSTRNAVGLSVLIPEIDFLVVELSEIEIVDESHVDCRCFSDTVKSLISLISLCEALFFARISVGNRASGGFSRRITGFSWI